MSVVISSASTQCVLFYNLFKTIVSRARIHMPFKNSATLFSIFLYPRNEVVGGYTGFTMSVRL
jgi:hypothetical protein